MEVCIYAEQQHARLQYVAHQLFDQWLSIKAILTSDISFFLSFDGWQINYSQTSQAEGEIHIIPHPYLFSAQPFEAQDKLDINGVPAFFGTNSHKDIPFDLFSLIFFFLSRAEEYSGFQPDKHGRFPYSAGLSFQAGVLQIPIVDIHVCRFRERLLEAKPGQTLKPLAYSFLPTIDVDYAYIYKHRPAWVLAGAWVRDFLVGRWRKSLLRLQVLFSLKVDPFFTFSQLEQLHTSAELSPKFFILIGDRSNYDKNQKHTNKPFQKLLKKLGEIYDLGLHPSYASFDQPERILMEKRRLEAILGKEISHSRQHFVRFQLPQTYRTLLNAGIRNDYSMGYPDRPGFRAGTARSFFWYDLEKEEKTDLLIHPFQLMDVMFKKYKNGGKEEAVKTAIRLRRLVQETGGTLSVIWHNSSLSTIDGWQGWDKTYKKIVEALKE